MAKKQKNPNAQLEKTLAIAGVLLVVFGSIVSLLNSSTNLNFVHDGIFDLIPLYSFNYLILLAGGFGAGYLVFRKADNKLFASVSVALLAMAVYFALDNLWLLATRQPGTFTPFWNRFFLGAGSLIALAVTAGIVYFFQRKPRQSGINIVTRSIFITLFISMQIYTLANIFYWMLVDPGEPSTVPLWLVLGGWLANPLVIALLAYLTLSPVRGKVQRLFYASFIGSFSYDFFLILWDSPRDVSLDANHVNETVALTVTLLLTGFLIWRTAYLARKA